LALVTEVAQDIGAQQVLSDENIAKISIVGVGMRNNAGIAAAMFDALAAAGINILMISTSEIKISCIIEDKYGELAVRVLHDAFGLENPPMKKR
jgi:aspartate kinase